MNEDYLDEDELEQEEGYLLAPVSSGDSDEDGGPSRDNEDTISFAGPIDSRSYEGKLTDSEISLINDYNKIASCTDLEEATLLVVQNIPKHTSKSTQISIVKQLFHKQGHSRLQNTKYTPLSSVTGREVDQAFGEDDADEDFNEEVYQKNREFIAKFIDYLAKRDLSRDSKTSKAKKLRAIPAFIIYLFSSGTFGYIINCPTMPKEYQELITRALKDIDKTRYHLVDELADEYEKNGRPKVADRVRKSGVGWFQKEPKEIYNAAIYRDLDLTEDDINIYRKYRSRFVNTTNSITQEVISEYIYVIVDSRKGTFLKLKDKTRAEAISDVKQEFEKFAKTHGTLEEQDNVTNILFK